MLLSGAPVRFAGPREAIAAGIGVVHQERNLIPRFSVGENIGLERLGGGFLRAIDYDAIHAEARKWLEVLELDLDPRTPVSQLNVAKVQLVEIAKALSLRSRVLAARRAHGLADAAGSEGAVSACCASCATRARACFSSATSSRKCKRSATR